MDSWKGQQPQHSAHQNAGLGPGALGTRNANACCVRVHAEDCSVRGRVRQGGAVAQKQQRINWDPVFRIY